MTLRSWPRSWTNTRISLSTGIEPFRALCSYAYFRNRDMAELQDSMWTGSPAQIFADSGAHSARTLGIHLDLDSYAQWCERWDPNLALYANLDVIKAPDQTYRHQKALEQRGLAPLPVFHTGSPWWHLERYLAEGYTYIALGALLGNPPDQVMPWLAKAFRLAHGRAVFHGFGLTLVRALREFPFYSVDSSSWSQIFRYGVALLFDDAKGRAVTLKLRDATGLLKHRTMIRAHGVDPVSLATREACDLAQMAGVAAVAYHRMQAWARRIHGAVTVPDGPRNPLTRRPPAEGEQAGLHLYLAGTDHFAKAAAGLAQLTGSKEPRA
jgi:hypothetical protein